MRPGPEADLRAGCCVAALVRAFVVGVRLYRFVGGADALEIRDPRDGSPGREADVPSGTVPLLSGVEVFVTTTVRVRIFGGLDGPPNMAG